MYQNINILKNEQGISHSNFKKLLNIIMRFYKNLYIEKPLNKEIRETIFEYLIIKILKEIAKSLFLLITTREIEKSIK